MSHGTKVIFALNLDHVDVGGPTEPSTFSRDQRADVLAHLRTFASLAESFSVVGDQKLTLETTLRSWGIPTAEYPELPLVHKGPEPVQTPRQSLDGPGDAVMVVSTNSIVFHTRT